MSKGSLRQYTAKGPPRHNSVAIFKAAHRSKGPLDIYLPSAVPRAAKWRAQDGASITATGRLYRPASAGIMPWPEPEPEKYNKFGAFLGRDAGGRWPLLPTLLARWEQGERGAKNVALDRLRYGGNKTEARGKKGRFGKIEWRKNKIHVRFDVDKIYDASVRN